MKKQIIIVEDSLKFGRAEGPVRVLESVLFQSALDNDANAPRSDDTKIWFAHIINAAEHDTKGDFDAAMKRAKDDIDPKVYESLQDLSWITPRYIPINIGERKTGEGIFSKIMNDGGIEENDGQTRTLVLLDVALVDNDLQRIERGQEILSHKIYRDVMQYQFECIPYTQYTNQAWHRKKWRDIGKVSGIEIDEAYPVDRDSMSDIYMLSEYQDMVCKALALKDT